MHDALNLAGIASSLILLGGANHEGPEFDRAAVSVGGRGLLP